MADVMSKHLKLTVPGELAAWLADDAARWDRPIAYVARAHLERARRIAAGLGVPPVYELSDFEKAEIKDAAETYVAAVRRALPPDKAEVVLSAELSRIDALLAGMNQEAA